MNKERDYSSDTDESDEDFRPDDVAGESPVSEDEEADDDSEAPEENDNDANQISKKKVKSGKKVTKKRKTKAKNRHGGSDDDEARDDIDMNTSRRSTRQAENVMKNGKEKTQEKDELISDEEDKTRTNALWADFLKDVNPTASSSEASIHRLGNKIQGSPDNGELVLHKNTEPKEHSRAIVEKSKHENKRTTVTEVLDFAGEEVRIECEVDASSIKENKAAAIQPIKKQPFGRIMPGVGVKRTVTTATGSASSGLGSIINQIGKKKKLSVLEKSQMDWNNFKQTEGIDEQLQTFNKGKDGYLERQDFLQRTDLRQFEIEKNLRQTTRRPL